LGRVGEEDVEGGGGAEEEGGEEEDLLHVCLGVSGCVGEGVEDDVEGDGEAGEIG
jgi:hypothetical protein